MPRTILHPSGMHQHMILQMLSLQTIPRQACTIVHKRETPGTTIPVTVVEQSPCTLDLDWHTFYLSTAPIPGTRLCSLKFPEILMRRLEMRVGKLFTFDSCNRLRKPSYSNEIFSFLLHCFWEVSLRSIFHIHEQKYNETKRDAYAYDDDDRGKDCIASIVRMAWCYFPLDGPFFRSGEQR